MFSTLKWYYYLDDTSVLKGNRAKKSCNPTVNRFCENYKSLVLLADHQYHAV